MPETDQPALIPAALPDEPCPTESPDDKNSFLETVRNSVAGIFERHGVAFKRGRGRPRKDGAPKISDVPLNAPPTALPAGVAPVPAPVDPAFDPALVKRCVSAVGKAMRGFLDKALHRRAVAAGFSPTEAKALVVETTITEDELNGFSELAEICLRKYGVGTQYAPEVGIAALFAGVGLRYSVAFKSLQPKGGDEKP